MSKDRLVVWSSRLRRRLLGPQLPPQFPRRLLRYLLVGHGLGVGSRVLDTGEDEHLVRFLRELRLEAFRPGDLGIQELYLEQAFDMVVLRDLKSSGKLRGEALSVVEQYLPSVRRGGSVVLLASDLSETRLSLSTPCREGITRRVARFDCGRLFGLHWSGPGAGPRSITAITFQIEAAGPTRELRSPARELNYAFHRDVA